MHIRLALITVTIFIAVALNYVIMSKIILFTVAEIVPRRWLFI